MTLAVSHLTLPGRLDAVSLALRPGEITAICGPNGAGKSTLLSCLAGLAGEGVTFDEIPLAALPPRERAKAIGYLPQSAEVAWDVSVETLVGLGRLPWQSGAGDDARHVDAALKAMELGALRQRPVSQLSGGERARALLARVLAGTPCWLLADEPLANLDLAHQLALLASLRALAGQGPDGQGPDGQGPDGQGPDGQGLGVVLVLHDLAHAMNHADRVIVLDRGRLVCDARPEKALDEATIAAVWGVKARWLGEPGQRALMV